MMSIKELRTKAKMSQSQFAARFGFPVASLQDWEQGRRTAPPYVISMVAHIMQMEARMDRILEEYEAVATQGYLKDVPEDVDRNIRNLLDRNSLVDKE